MFLEQKLFVGKNVLMKLSIRRKMKRIHTIIFVLILIFGSCAKNENDIFSLSPAERMDNALINTTEVLTSSKNGWVMEYFANSNSPGYNLLVKFEPSGQAIFAASNEFTNNKTYMKDSCLFEMIGDNGPVLTFNTYNKILHVFSDPVDPYGSSALDGYGLDGDYEFVVLKTDTNQLVLKGKKKSAIIVMNKLPENITWEKYVSDLDDLNTLLFANNTTKLSMTVDKSVYSFSNGTSHIFSVQKYGANSTAFDVPFIITQKGIRFYESVEFEGVAVQNFELNAEKSALVCTENTDIRILGQDDLAAYFMSTVKTWVIVPEKMSANIKTQYDAVVQSCVTNYNAENVQLAIKYYSSPRNSFVLSLSFKIGQTSKEGNLDLAITSSKNSLAITNKNTGDSNGLIFKSDITELSNLVGLLSSNFSLSTVTKINPQVITLTKKTESSTWFSIISL